MTPTVQLPVSIKYALRRSEVQPISAIKEQCIMAWELTGNAGTDPATDFIGTIDAQPLVLKANSKEALRVNAQGFIGVGIDPQAHFHIVSRVELQLPGRSGGAPQVVIARTLAARQGSTSPVNFDFVVRDGSIGIGTASPAEKLSVVGVIESTSGGIKFPDGTTQTTAGVTQQQLFAQVANLGAQINNLLQQLSNLQQQITNVGQQVNGVAQTAATAKSEADEASSDLIGVEADIAELQAQIAGLQAQGH
jgi:hypothetical protein